MPLPATRAIQLADLEFIDTALPPSGHAIKTVLWVDSSKRFLQGVYKGVDPHYPPILAKFSVAVSVWLQMALGEFAAEERLVFDDAHNVVGTVSLLIEDFVPLLSSGETPSPMSSERLALANPSLDTLLAHHIAIILVAAMLMKCDDRHPGNFGLRYNSALNRRDCFIIDNDMSFYSYTCYMKGFRVGYDGIFRHIEPKMMQLVKQYLDNFPDIHGRVHWPTNLIPLNGNPFKRYVSREAFLALSGSAVFQEQKMARLLVHLLTYEPKMLGERLKLYLGELPLAFNELDPIAVQGLMESYPEQFNEASNDAPFYQMMLKLFEQEYNELYREVVYYPGCEANSYGLRVPSFYQFLIKGTSTYVKTVAWAGEQNQLWQELPVETHFNLSLMHQRMYQLWRDSFRPRVKLLVAHLNHLKQTTADDGWLLVDGIEATKTQSHDVLGLAQLENYMTKFLKICQDYFAMVLPSSEITHEIIEKSNLIFYQGLCQLTQGDADKIADVFKEHRCRQKPFLRINAAIKDLMTQSNWAHYISQAPDFEGAFVAWPKLPLMVRAWDEPHVIQDYLTVLFDWAAKPSSMPQILQCIRGAIKKYQASYFSPITRRKRDQEVLDYLERVVQRKQSEEDFGASQDGANILATILSTNGLESNSLNTLILVELLPVILHAVKSTIEYDFQCIEDAVHAKTFDPVIYMGRARQYVRRDERFSHIYTYEKEVIFNRAMYYWVDDLSPELFRRLVSQALDAYKPYSFNVFRLFTSREPTVRKYLMDPSLKSSQILGSIFMDRGCNESGILSSTSLNHGMFEIIFDAMQTDFRENPDKKDRYEGFALVAEIDKLQAMKYLATDVFQRIAQKWAGKLILPHQTEPMAASMMA